MGTYLRLIVFVVFVGLLGMLWNMAPIFSLGQPWRQASQQKQEVLLMKVISLELDKLGFVTGVGWANIKHVEHINLK